MLKQLYNILIIMLLNSWLIKVCKSMKKKLILWFWNTISIHNFNWTIHCHLQVNQNKSEIIKVLLESDITINLFQNQPTALLSAIYYNCIEAIKTLLENPRMKTMSEDVTVRIMVQINKLWNILLKMINC